MLAWHERAPLSFIRPTTNLPPLTLSLFLSLFSAYYIIYIGERNTSYSSVLYKIPDSYLNQTPDS